MYAFVLMHTCAGVCVVGWLVVCACARAQVNTALHFWGLPFLDIEHAVHSSARLHMSADMGVCHLYITSCSLSKTRCSRATM